MAGSSVRGVLTFFFALLALALSVATARAVPAPVAPSSEPRLALVIGNTDYSGGLTKLINPANDVDRISAALRKTGFASNLAVARNRSRSQILADVRAFADSLRAAGPTAIGFFYYSGHGGSAIEGSRRRNYLIPVGAPISKADDLVAEGVPLDTIVEILSAARARAIFIVFDACRTELPWSRGGDDADKAFGAVAARPGVFVAFSTDQGATAPDDGAFAQAIATEIVKPGQSHLVAFDAAARTVALRRSTDRLPWYSNQINGQPVYFAGPGAGPPPQSTAPQSTAPQSSFDARTADTAYWNSCCAVAANAGADDYRAYLARVESGDFPGLYKDIAQRRLAAIAVSDTGAPPKPAAMPTPKFAFFGVGDYDNDGYADIIARSEQSGELFLYPGAANGRFASRVRIGVGWMGYDFFGLGDWNRDNKLDLVVRNAASGELWLYPGEGKRALSQKAPERFNGLWNDQDPFGLGDWSKQGLPGIVTRKRQTEDLILNSPQNWTPSITATYKIGERWGGLTFFGLTDFDRDGSLDIIARKDATGDLFLYPGQSTRGISARKPIQIGNGWSDFDPVGAVDWNRDGLPDLVVRKKSDLTLWLYPGAGAARFGPPTQIGEGW